jgi:serine/threonine-protein kinase
VWQVPYSWSRDGKTLLLTTASIARNLIIEALSIEGDRSVKTLLQGKYDPTEPMISPDGRWLAYTSIESGKSEVYVRPFPDVDKGGKWQVSTSGGQGPLWSPDGRELFYRNEDSAMAVAVQPGASFQLGKTETLFQGKYSAWDVTRDGKRFLMVKQPASAEAVSEEDVPRKIVVVANWFEELKQRVPTK